MIAGNGVHQVNPAMHRLGRHNEIGFCQTRAGMRQRVDFEREPFLEPALELFVLWINLYGHDAHRGAAINLFETFQNWAEEGLIFLEISHVVYRKSYHRFNAGLAHPLWRYELRKIRPDVKWIVL